MMGWRSMRECILLERPTLLLMWLLQMKGVVRTFTPVFIGREIRFKTAALESFAARNWNNIVFDALVVAATVEFCDRALAKKAAIWGREFDLRIAVHDANLWSSGKSVSR